MKFIHTADFHLSGSNRLSDFENSLNQISVFAKEQDVNFIVIAGDIFHKRTPDNSARTVFYKFVKKVEPIAVFALVGTHDSDLEAHSLTPLKSLGLSNLFILDSLDVHYFTLPTQVSILSVPQLVRKFSVEDVKQKVVELLSSSDQYKLVLGHFSVIGASTENYVVTELSKDFILPKSLFDDPRINYVALGHIHKPQEFGKVKYSGPVEHVKFGEKDNDVGFYFIDTDSKVSFIPLQVRPMADLILDSETFIEQVKALPDKAVVRMFYSNDKQVPALDDIKKMLEDKGCLLHEPVNFVRKSVEQTAEQASSSTNTWEDLVREEIEKSENLDKELLYKEFNEALRS